VSERYGYILLTDEKWWNRRYSQNKAGKKLQAFVRKGTVGPTNAELVFFYVKHPVKEIRGFGEFVERVKGHVDELWDKYGHETVFESRKEYVDFVQGRTKATFIRFKNLRLLSTPISLNVISQVVGIGRMPRGGRYINKEIARELI